MQRIVILFLSLFSVYGQASCNISSDALKAEYTITTVANEGDKVLSKVKLILWRKGQQVAHQYPDTQIVEGWDFINKKMIKPTRYFEKHQRAIEYQPGEAVHGKKETDWSARHQLIAEKLKQSMSLKNTTKQACEVLEHYVLNNAHNHLKLDWLSSSHLIKGFVVKGKHKTQLWTLDKVSYDAKQVSQFFKTLLDYDTTDYADIGDDHTDPFLNNMVNLGFIEHGASGFYHAEGDSHGHKH
ncbi:hypothetical protein [Pleionea sp. CnH1-48]|uniref:hypothetical protein n=1 Tax=Pleionea sp. CnH1-48 TaxID=2954494 RepID=UPI002096EB6D|nr:hypothetical protein [Pleionea sp. CnH1-48]MCO7223925.1 hypothetical protein [Pleionea sp. CnH1-48]